MEEEVKNERERSPDKEPGEVKSSLEEEIKAGEWHKLGEFPKFRKRSRQGRILAVYQAISNRLTQLVALFYELARDKPDKADRLLKEINKLRDLQAFLLDCLTWEEIGQLEDHDIPSDLEKLI